jgi:hypothetical protein
MLSRCLFAILAFALIFLAAGCSDSEPSISVDECRQAIGDPGCCSTMDSPKRYYLADEGGRCEPGDITVVGLE